LSGTDDRRAEVAAVARRLAAQGLLGGTSGNVSARDGSGVCITGTGIPWPDVDASAVTVLDAAGARVAGPAPSSETPLHRAIYARRPDVGAIVHTHSRFATVFSVLRRPIEAVHYLLAFAGDRVRVAEYACYGTDALADAAVAAMGSDRAVLLANHGLVAVGADPSDAERVAVAVEEVASLHWHALAIGTPTVLSSAEMAEVAGRFSTYGRRG
jgi:L-fuculose-phosphate aldolase